jgi:type I restriction enzyme S subunit
MFAKRFSVEWLTPARLDTDYYNPDAISVIQKIKKRGDYETFGSSGDVWGFGAYELCNQIQESIAVDAPGFIKIGDIKPPFVDVDLVLGVTEKTHAILSSAQVKSGDLLVSIAGTIGAAAIVPETRRKLSANQAIVKYRANQEKLDAYFVCAYSLSNAFNLITAREAGGAVQKNLYLYNFLTIPIPRPKHLVQKYIGDKVRQAERLRAWAKLAEIHVNQYHRTLVPQQSSLDFAKRIRVVSPARMSERLDAHFYPGVVDEYVRLHQGKFKQLGKLCVTIYNGQTQPETDSSNSCQQITVTNLSSSFLGGIPRDVEAPGKKEKFLKPHDILMCNAAHNKTYIGKDLTFVHSEAAILPSTEVMTIRVDRNQVPASYVRAYLLTKLGYVQIQSTIRGITAHSYPDDMALLDIYVPDVAEKDRDDWFACDEKLALAGKACEIATQLTNAAKLLVEALIEGQLTEAELIAAEHALQAGNDQLDRRILNRLKTDGVDGQGPALFGDLDEFYRLLTQAEED